MEYLSELFSKIFHFFYFILVGKLSWKRWKLIYHKKKLIIILAVFSSYSFIEEFLLNIFSFLEDCF